MVIVGLVVFIPLIPSMNTIEIFRLSRPVFIVPPVHLNQQYMVEKKSDSTRFYNLRELIILLVVSNGSGIKCIMKTNGKD